MNHIKKASLSSAAVLLLAAGPLLWQYSETNKRLVTLTELEERLISAKTPPQPPTLLGKRTRLSATDSTPTNIRDLLRASEQPLSARQLIEGGWDQVRVLPFYMAVARQDCDALIEEIAAAPDSNGKESALLQIATFASFSDPQKSMERLMELGVRPDAYSRLLGQWASEDPDAAYAWYEQKRETGELFGTAVYGSPDQVLMGNLIRGMGKEDPQRALDLFAEVEDEGTRMEVMSDLGVRFANELNRSGDDTRFLQLMEMLDPDERTLAVSSAMSAWGFEGSMEDGLALVERHLEEPGERHTALVRMLGSYASNPFEKKAAWLLNNVPPEENAAAINQLVKSTALNDSFQINKWLESQASSEIRDQGFESLAEWQIGRQSFDTALRSSQAIEDESTRQAILDRLGERWITQDPENARNALPPDVIDRVEFKLSQQ